MEGDQSLLKKRRRTKKERRTADRYVAFTWAWILFCVLFGSRALDRFRQFHNSTQRHRGPGQHPMENSELPRKNDGAKDPSILTRRGEARHIVLVRHYFSTLEEGGNIPGERFASVMRGGGARGFGRRVVMICRLVFCGCGNRKRNLQMIDGLKKGLLLSSWRTAAILEKERACCGML